MNKHTKIILTLMIHIIHLYNRLLLDFNYTVWSKVFGQSHPCVFFPDLVSLSVLAVRIAFWKTALSRVTYILFFIHI